MKNLFGFARLALVFSASLLSVAAQAQDTMPPRVGMGAGMGGMGPGMGGMRGKMPVFADFDLNGDGAITEQELEQGRAQRISERAQEGRQMRNLGNAPTFQQLDANGDGKISADEFAAHQKAHRQSRRQQRGQGMQ